MNANANDEDIDLVVSSLTECACYFCRGRAKAGEGVDVELLFFFIYFFSSLVVVEGKETKKGKEKNREEEKKKSDMFSHHARQDRETSSPTSKNMGRPRMPSVGSFSVVFLRRAAMSRRSD